MAEPNVWLVRFQHRPPILEWLSESGMGRSARSNGMSITRPIGSNPIQSFLHINIGQVMNAVRVNKENAMKVVSG